MDPVRDKEVIDLELQLRDLETIESRISRVQKQAQTGGDREAKAQYEVLKRYKDALEQGRSARTVELLNKDEEKIAHELFLLTNKPVLYVCNVDDKSAVIGNAYVDAVREAVKDENAQILVVAAQTESEIAELEDYEERQMFLQEIGLEESGVNRFIRAEIIKYDDYIHYGSEAAVKEAGKLHIEGKEYVMQDGDIVVFRFNV